MRHGLALLFFLCCGVSAMAQEPDIPPESPSADIGYPSPQAALTALINKPGVRMWTENGFLVAFEQLEGTLWMFAPRTDPAFPAVLRDRVRVEGRKTVLDMIVMCGGSKAACDRGYLTFKQVTEHLRDQLQAEIRRNPPSIPR